MAGRFQPEHGADSPDATRPYVVRMIERFDGHPRIKVRIDAAYGPRDAKNQAELDYPGYTFIDATEDADVLRKEALMPDQLPGANQDAGGIPVGPWQR